MRRLGLASLLALVALATVLADGVRSPGDRHTRAMAAAAPTDTEPFDLASVSATIAGHYHFAADHLAELEQIPCWCGCEQFLAHRHLADCFVRADGRGWEAHAAGCGVCIGEAVIARRMLEEGRTPAEIKAAVDIRFGPTVITTPAAVT